MEVESELAETIEMVDVPAIEPPAAPVLKLVEDFTAPDAGLEFDAPAARDAAAARRAAPERARSPCPRLRPRRSRRSRTR